MTDSTQSGPTPEPTTPEPTTPDPAPNPGPTAPAAPPAQPYQPVAQQLPPAGYPPLAPPYFAPPPPERGAFKRGFGLGAGAGLGVGAALVVFGIVSSLITGLMMMALAGSLAGAAQTTAEPLVTLWGKDTAPHRLRAISISGAIMADASDGTTLGGGAYGYEIAQVLDGLEAADGDGVVLLINTPGGSINGSRAIADAVARYQTRTEKKVFAYVQGMSASGGVYSMVGADKILADHGSLVGSIGVIAGPFDHYQDVTSITGSMLTSGVVAGSITSEYLTQGTGKDFGNPFRAMTEQERTIFSQGLANEYDEFVARVAAGRGIGADTIKGTLGAHIFDTKTAEGHGLIDGTAGRDEAFQAFARDAGLDPDQTRLVGAQAPGLLAQLLGAQARVYGTSLPAPEIGGQRHATATLCTGSPVILAYSGSLTGVCG